MSLHGDVFCSRLRLKAGFYLKDVFPPRNLDISFAFQATEKPFTHPMNLCFAVTCKFWGDFGGYLRRDSFSQWISEI